MNYGTLPLVNYRGILAPNLMRRFRTTPEFVEARSLFHPYTIQDGDRPDTIAEYYYQDSYLDWLVLIANNIYNVNKQWPLTAEQFERVIRHNYQSTANALSTISHYTVKFDPRSLTDEQFNVLPPDHKKYWLRNAEGQWHFTQKQLVLTTAQYNNLPAIEKAVWEPMSAYHNLELINEAKRNIVLIDESQVQRLKDLARRILQ